MKVLSRLLILFCLILSIVSCDDDDDTTKPVQQLKVELQENVGTSVKVVWDVIKDAESYQVKYWLDEEGSEPVITTVKETTLLLENLKPETKYNLTIIALDSNDKELSTKTVAFATDKEQGPNFQKEGEHCLNVVYFIPSDKKVIEGYEERISGILLQGQEFYKKNMIANGFGEKTFALVKDAQKKLVDITVINAKGNAASYSDPGANTYFNIRKEVEEYLAKNDRQFSAFSLIFIPAEGLNQGDNNYPFCGAIGASICLDHADLTIANLEAKNENAVKFIGGAMHELGHGFGAPHNMEKVSEKADANKGTALMGAGNYTYGKEPTFITKTMCSIFNNMPVFGYKLPEGVNFYTDPKTVIRVNEITQDGSAINISGTFDATVDVKYANIFFNPINDQEDQKLYNIGNDYDAVAFAGTIKDGEFNFTVDAKEIVEYNNKTFHVKIQLLNDNSFPTELVKEVVFTDGVGNFEEFTKLEVVDQSNWKVIAFSDEQKKELYADEHVATMAFDGDHQTYWHSQWAPSQIGYNHWISVDMQEEVNAKGFTFTHAEYSAEIMMRPVKGIQFAVIDAEGKEKIIWAGETGQVKGPQTFKFDKAATFSKFKIIMLTPWSEISTEANLAAFAELQILK